MVSMKNFSLLVLLFICSASAYSQDTETITEERSSAWLKIASPVANIPKRVTPARKKAVTIAKVTNKKPAPVQKTNTTATLPTKSEEFNKTNSKVKRFQKENK